ncbi:MAG TPA: TonB family protein [Pyrinomonadaceae bacterium]|nr:TonB family protein [Pyrinomonadaceae bacterium]
MIHHRFTFGVLILVASLFSCAALALPSGVYVRQGQNAAPGTKEQGIALYNQGNDPGAVQALRLAVKERKDDVSAWHYLGLALGRQGKAGDARKAHEKAAKLGEKFLDNLLASVAYPDAAASLLPHKMLLADAADSADKYLALSSKLSRSKAEEWNDRAELLRDYAQLSGASEATGPSFKVYSTREVTTKARILFRQEPMYTEDARKHSVSGTVVLRAVLAFDGRVRGIRVVSGLPYGLTSASIKSARRIKFEPATIDGQPVSQYIQIEYNFNIF